jgi:hypothetical protein
VHATGVDPPEDFDAVPRPGGDLGRWDAGVESERDAAVAKIVGAPGELV